MKAWSAFYPDVLIELPGAPLPLVDHWLRNAAIEFCERSKAYRLDLAALDTVAAQMGYAVTPPDGLEPIEILSVTYDGEPLTVQAPGALSDRYGDWQAEVGTPEYFTQQDGATLLLVPAPADAAVAALKIKAAVKPSPTATGIDDWLFSRWRTAIASGCKAHLLLMADKPWSNPDRATLNAGRFEEAIAKATGDANNGFVRATPRFGGSFC